MIPLKLFLTYDPAQIGFYYQRGPSDHKKYYYVIQLHGLIYAGESTKITKILYEKHSDYLSPKLIKPEQIQKLIDMLLERIHSQLIEYEEEAELSSKLKDGAMLPEGPGK